jgi:hypothetical protein
MMQTNLKEALKNADGIKSPLGDVACYSLNFAELAQEVNVHLQKAIKLNSHGGNMCNWLKLFGTRLKRQAVNVLVRRLRLKYLPSLV